MSTDAAPRSSDFRPRTAEGDDAALLRQYVSEGSQAAFAELVRQRVGLVYAVALRQLHGDPHRAREATQMVFTDLARKAPALANRPLLAGWLFRSAQFAAAGLLRAEHRRHVHETAAHTMKEILGPEETPPDWDKVRPVLDQALNALDERDRDVLVLRFFDQRRFAEIGAQLRLSENAARMRVDRALDKLRAVMARRGVTSTTAALGLALGQQIAIATPPGLAAAVSGAALATVAATGGTFAFMSLSTLHVGITAAVALAGASAYVVQSQTSANLRREIAILTPAQQQIAALQKENRRLEKLLAEATAKPAFAAPATPTSASTPVASPSNRSGAWSFSPSGGRPEGTLRLVNKSDFPSRIQEWDQIAQKTMEKMNREGNALVEDYKAPTARAAASGLSLEEKKRLEAKAQSQMDAIRAKQREIQTFVETTKTYLEEQARKIRAGDTTVAAEDIVVLRLPHADPETALSSYETISGHPLIRDPSLVNVRGVVDLPAWLCTKSDALESLRLALRDQLSIDLQSTPSGIIARARPKQ